MFFMDFLKYACSFRRKAFTGRDIMLKNCNPRVSPFFFSLFAILLLCILSTLSDAIIPDAANAQTTGSQNITLKSGFNFISFTVAPEDSAQTIISKNPIIDDIYLYNATASSFLSVSEGTLTKVSAGKGYIIKSKADTNININGPPISAIGDIQLKKGFNLLGISKLSSSSTVNTFSGLMKASSAIAGIYKWSPGAGGFIQVIHDNENNITMLDSIDPKLNAGEAYFINVTEDTKINYDENNIKLTKIFTGIYTDPGSDAVLSGETYDINKIKIYAIYSDGSTVEITTSAIFTANVGKIAEKIYTAPNYSTTAIFTISYTDETSDITREGYFTLTINDSNTAPVKTTLYRCSYKLAPGAKIVDEETSITESVTSEQIVLKITETSNAPQPGNVIIGYYGDGYLRKATAVSLQDGKAFITTTRANLEDAFETLDYAYKGKLSTLHASNTSAPGSIEAGALARFLRSKAVMPAPSPDRSIISKDNLKKIMDNVSITVSLTKADVSFDPVIECDIEIGLFKLKKFLFAVGGDLTAGLEFSVEAKAKADLPIKSEIEIFHSTPHFFSIGPVPFSFEWDINCGVEANVSVTGSYNFSGTWKYGVRAGAQYSSETGSWTRINQITKTSSSENNYELKGALEIKPYFNIGFAIKLAAVTGPKIYLEAFFLFLAEMQSLDKVDITVSAGVGASVSFLVEILSWNLAEFNSELFSLSWEIYKNTIDFFIAEPIISPGGGNFTSEQTVEITCATLDTLIRYTTDSSAPSASHGTVYSGPFLVSHSASVKAIAYKSATIISNITTANFAINDILFPETPESDFYFTCSIHGDYTSSCDEYCSSYSASYRPASQQAATTITVPASCIIKEKSRPINTFILSSSHKIEALKISEGIKNISAASNSYLKKAVLPSSIETINFSSCQALNDVSMSYGISIITGSAFKGCSSLISIELPSSVTQIGDYAFQDCGNLSSTEFPPQLEYIGRNSFQHSALRAAVMPDSVATLGVAAFAYTSNLATVKLSAKLTSVPSYAFTQSGITEIEIPDGITEISSYAFTSCKNLETVKCGKSLDKIGQMAFYLCSSLKSIYFTGNAPAIDGEIYLPNALYYKAGTTGWTTPTWNGKNCYPY